MIQLSRSTFSPESTNDPTFRASLHCFICNVDDTLDSDTVELAGDYQVDSEDEHGFRQLKNALLVQFISYCLQKPVSADEVIDCTHLNLEDAEKFNFSSQDEKSKSEILQTEIEQLESRKATLQAEIEQLEQQKIQMMRKKPSSRNHRMFSTLDEYFEDMLTTAVAEATQPFRPNRAGGAPCLV